MARIYNDRNDNPLANLAQSYLDERFRKRSQQLARDELQMGQDLKANEIYKTVNRNKQGDYSGLASNISDRERDTPGLKKIAPQFWPDSQPQKTSLLKPEAVSTQTEEEYLRERAARDAQRAAGGPITVQSIIDSAKKPYSELPVDQARIPQSVLSQHPYPKPQDATPARPEPLLKSIGDSVTLDIPGKPAKPGEAPMQRIITPPVRQTEELVVDDNRFNPSDILLSKIRDASVERLKTNTNPQAINEVTAMLADKVRLGKEKGGMSLGEALVAYKDATGTPPNKDVIAILSGQDRLAYGKGRQEDQQAFAKDKNKQSYITGLNRMFRSDPLVRTGTEALVGAQRLKTLANDPNPQGFQRGINIYLTKTFGDRGQLSNLDASSAAQLEGLLEQLQGFASRISGKGITKEQREVYLRIVSGLEQVAEQSIRNYARDFARSEADSAQMYGLDPMEVAANLVPETLISGSKNIPKLPPKTEGRIINPESNRLGEGTKNFKPTKPEIQLRDEMKKMNDALKALEAAKIPAERKATIKRQIQQDFYDRTKKLDPEGKGVKPTRPDGSDVP